MLLKAKVLCQPKVSNTTPPAVEPSAMESWITATINPPPASASSGNVRAIHVHQPVGAAVASIPQKPNSRATIHRLSPVSINTPAISAISSGMAIKVR